MTRFQFYQMNKNSSSKFIMKAFKKLFTILMIVVALPQLADAQQTKKDSTGLPGDHFSLQGALQMFQKSKSPEEFEKLLNTQSNNVNNLDLNKDGKTDYVKVIDKSEKKVHAFILQVPVSQKESQDVAVIELEKTGDTTAVIQIVGDKDLYGKEVILEPGSNSKKDIAVVEVWNSNTSGPSPGYPEEMAPVVVVNVWHWPCVTFVYGAVYTPWVSPWRWGYYPTWWAPWAPATWAVWYPRCTVYNYGFVAANTYRVTGARYLYTPYRTSAVSVSRTAGVAYGSNGVVAGARTTVTGPAGNSATRTTVVGANRNGAVRAGRTTVVRRN